MLELVKNNPYLYILVRNPKDLPSLNPGKGTAHGVHAGHQMVHQLDRENKAHVSWYEEWIDWSEYEMETEGYGVTITLSVNHSQLSNAVEIARLCGFHARTTTDPTYPYVVDREIYNLIDPRFHTMEPVFRGDKVILHRAEVTAGYIFGPKEGLKPILGNFDQLP